MSLGIHDIASAGISQISNSVQRGRHIHIDDGDAEWSTVSSVHRRRGSKHGYDRVLLYSPLVHVQIDIGHMYPARRQDDRLLEKVSVALPLHFRLRCDNNVSAALRLVYPYKFPAAVADSDRAELQIVWLGESLGLEQPLGFRHQLEGGEPPSRRRLHQFGDRRSAHQDDEVLP